jgi:hypothetical protein
MNDNELSYAICDLYEKSILQIKILAELGPSIAALVQTMTDRDPGFASAYAEQIAAAKQQPMFHALPGVVDLLSREVQKIKARQAN